MTPVQFLSRLASLIPPPQFPLQRLSGVFGPRSPLRAAVVPRGPARAGATPTLPRAKRTKKQRAAKKPDDASVFAARAEGASPERGGDSENAGRSRPRTSLGDGVVKPGAGGSSGPSFYAASITPRRLGGRQCDDDHYFKGGVRPNNFVSARSSSRSIVQVRRWANCPPMAPQRRDTCSASCAPQPSTCSSRCEVVRACGVRPAAAPHVLRQRALLPPAHGQDDAER